MSFPPRFHRFSARSNTAFLQSCFDLVSGFLFRLRAEGLGFKVLACTLSPDSESQDQVDLASLNVQPLWAVRP